MSDAAGGNEVNRDEAASAAARGNYLERDEIILDHIMRYRITTPRILHGMGVFKGLDRTAVTKVTSRLCENECLQKWPLYGPYQYFMLGRKWARRKNIEQRRIKEPLPPKPLYEAYATLSFCFLTKVPREKLRAAEIIKDHPELLAKGIDPSSYYFDYAEGQKRLSVIYATTGSQTQSIIDSARRRIFEPRRHHPGFRKWIDTGRFMIAFVTFSEDKRAAIDDALRQARMPFGWRVEGFPELLNLLPRR